MTGRNLPPPRNPTLAASRVPIRVPAPFSRATLPPCGQSPPHRLSSEALRRAAPPEALDEPGVLEAGLRFPFPEKEVPHGPGSKNASSDEERSRERGVLAATSHRASKVGVDRTTPSFGRRGGLQNRSAIPCVNVSCRIVG